MGKDGAVRLTDVDGARSTRSIQGIGTAGFKVVARVACLRACCLLDSVIGLGVGFFFRQSARPAARGGETSCNGGPDVAQIEVALVVDGQRMTQSSSPACWPLGK